MTVRVIWSNGWHGMSCAMKNCPSFVFFSAAVARKGHKNSRGTLNHRTKQEPDWGLDFTCCMAAQTVKKCAKVLLNDQTLTPFLQQLDAEVEYIQNSWETVRGVQARLEVEELRGGAVEEEDLSKLLKLQERVNKKIQQSKSILEQSSSFHKTSQQVSSSAQMHQKSAHVILTFFVLLIEVFATNTQIRNHPSVVIVQHNKYEPESFLGKIDSLCVQRCERNRCEFLSALVHHRQIFPEL